MMTEVYEQEHNSMMSIIGDARRSLALTVDELHDEQQVLSLTADKISRCSLLYRRRSPCDGPSVRTLAITVVLYGPTGRR